jgi:hypothetical protein
MRVRVSQSSPHHSGSDSFAPLPAREEEEDKRDSLARAAGAAAACGFPRAAERESRDPVPVDAAVWLLDAFAAAAGSVVAARRVGPADVC